MMNKFENIVLSLGKDFENYSKKGQVHFQQ